MLNQKENFDIELHFRVTSVRENQGIRFRNHENQEKMTLLREN